MGVPVEGKEQTAEVDQLPGLICWDVRNTSCVLSQMWSAIILVPFAVNVGFTPRFTVFCCEKRKDVNYEKRD